MVKYVAIFYYEQKEIGIKSSRMGHIEQINEYECLFSLST